MWLAAYYYGLNMVFYFVCRIPLIVCSTLTNFWLGPKAGPGVGSCMTAKRC